MTKCFKTYGKICHGRTGNTSDFKFDDYHFYKRYVDDGLFIISKNKPEYTDRISNSSHPRLQFTPNKETVRSVEILGIHSKYNRQGQIETDS